METKQKCLDLLRDSLDDPEGDFRSGQWESIEALLQRKRLLVVQRTGWGKSLVYFIATKILRDQGAGPTLLISPLLSLMRDQIIAAGRIGIRARTINSSNTDDWNEIEGEIRENEIDILLISPERLANDAFRQNILQYIAHRIGLFVVDEAHCISDWGHDFRPDYKRIVRVLRALPKNIPVLATTATANNRVVNDIVRQLGDLKVVRGPLVRTSLRLQNIRLPSPATRLAWLVGILPQISGSGIIYTLTKRDAERVTNWLQNNDFDVMAYHSESENREDLEEKLKNNEVKALVSTVALGMGFDKPDISFVIHYQRPGSVVHYYQQVGRAGRTVDNAYGILLSGEEDKEITDYFIRSAFPPLGHVTEVLDVLSRAEDGLSVPMMQQLLNKKTGEIQKVLKLLSIESPSPIVKNGSRWYRTATDYQEDDEQIRQLTEIRQCEQAQMLDYMQSETCLMKFLADALDDPYAEKCGKCAVCGGSPLLPMEPDNNLINKASIFLNRSYQPLEPRKQWPSGFHFQQYNWSGKILPSLQCETGKTLSLWGDAGWGEMVKIGKYQEGRFDDRLVEGCAEMIEAWRPDPFPTWLTCVPSIDHPQLVQDFAKRLAIRLNIPFQPCIRKKQSNPQQKTMQNSFLQAQNLDGVFELIGNVPAGSVFLVDDMVDSRWTITVIGAILRHMGSGQVFPLALALNSLS